MPSSPTVGSNSPFLLLLLSGTGRILFLVVSVIKHHHQHVRCDRGKLIVLLKEIEGWLSPSSSNNRNDGSSSPNGSNGSDSILSHCLGYAVLALQIEQTMEQGPKSNDGCSGPSTVAVTPKLTFKNCCLGDSAVLKLKTAEFPC